MPPSRPSLFSLPLIARPRGRWAYVLLGLSLSSSAAPPSLPVPAGLWVKSGAATRQTVGNTMTIRQRSANATLQWDSFNIGADQRVRFQQPDASSVALNLIGQNEPARIFGTLEANGQVYLINRNGIVFGRGAQVNVAGLIASTLNITPEAANGGLLRAAADGKPAFSAFLDADGAPASGAVRIARGASLRAAKGGNVLVFAPVISHDGSIQTPDGQTILAAGDKAYLMASNDVNLRGLLVEVDVDQISDATLEAFLKSRDAVLPAGTVSTQGSIEAARGNVTLAGLAVNQQGRVSATTAVNANGTIRLQARDRVSFLNQSTTVDGTPVAIDPAVPARGGRLTVGPNGSARITAEVDDPATQLAVNAQAPGTVTLTGRQIELQSGAVVQAQGGRIEASARADFSANRADDSRISIAPGATLDVAGASASLPASAHSLKLRLTATQLADSPVLRKGPLRGQEVTVDLFRAGSRSDGSRWIGTPIGDVASAAQTVPATVAERTSAGGTVALAANGAALLASGARVNLRGGILHYAAGSLATSWLYTPQGTLVDIADADPSREYAGVFGNYALFDRRWGVTRRWELGLEHAVPDYHLTQANGTLQLSAPQVYLAAEVLAETRRGVSQRGIPGGARHEILPAGAGLMLGKAAGDTGVVPDYLSPDVLLAVTPAALAGLRDADGSAFDPLTDALPASLTSTALAPDLFGPGHVQRASIYSNGTISLPAGARIALSEGGDLSLSGGRIELAGSVRAPSGSFSATARETLGTALADVALDLTSTAEIDLRGRWVNDRQALLRGQPLAPTLIDGGSLSLQSQGGALRLAAGGVLDVGGGAWLSSTALTAGRGGNLSLAVTPLPDIRTAAPVTLLAELRGEALRKAGSLNLALPAVCLASSNCAGAGVNWLAPTLFAGGFGQYSVTANLGDLTVSPGTRIAPQVHSRVLDDDYSSAPDADSLAGLSRVALLPAVRRPAADLTLRVRAAPLSQGYDDAGFATAGRLRIGRDAQVAVEPGGRLSLDANTAMVVDGELSAPAGTLALTLSNSLSLATGSSAAGLLARQSLWLGPHSRLLATGSLQTELGVGGFAGSTALAGGTLQITAERGYVLQQPGSLLDVSGIAAGTPLPDIASGAGPLPMRYDSAGGALLITAGEGLVLAGRLRGAAGGAHSGAGLLSVTLDPGLRNEPSDVFAGSFSHLPATLSLSGAGQLPVGYASEANAPAPAVAQARGTLRVAQVKAGGFDRLALAARNQTSADPQGQPIPGAIRFIDAPQLTLARGLDFSAASLGSDGTLARLQAPYVALGNRANTAAFAQAVGTSAGGDGELEVTASLIDLVGHSATQGFGQISLVSGGDLRLIGLQDLGSSAPTARRRLRGGLTSGAALDFTAAQIYPTTLSEFELVLSGNPRGLLAFHAAPGPRPDLPLSAAGRLTVRAPAILQAGVLRAPFGQIDLDAERRLTLTSQSLTSVSARGALIPFGTTQGGFDWTYPLAGGETLVFDGALDRLNAPRVALAAAELRLAPGAAIDLRGGGDLLAYEFAPGPNGTRDLLSPAISPSAFAVLPGVGDYAPADALYASGSLLPGDDSVVLAASPALAAGRYARLPARYALLPGAVLVTPQSGYQQQPAFPAVRAPDGSAVVSGHLEATGSGARLGPDEGFRVLPGSVLADFAEYAEHRANAFFPQQAQARDRVVPAIPADAGLLQIIARGPVLDFAAQVLGAAASGGRGAAVDIASSLPITIGHGQSLAVGGLQLQAPALNALEVSSLLIGGLRRTVDEGYAIDTLTPALRVDAGASLLGAELLLSARDSLALAGGARVEGGGTGTGAAARWQLQGDGAFLRAAGGPAATILRDGESASPTRGSFSLAAGATLGASGSVQIDASKALTLDGALALDGGSLSLGAPRIALGDVVGSDGELVLGNALLAGLRIDELLLNSRSGIDLVGPLAPRVERLVLNGPGLGGYDGPDASATLSAGEIVLANPGAYVWQAAAGRPPGSGALQLVADTLRLADSAGDFTLQGFSRVSARLDRGLVAEGEGRLAFGGDLALAAPVITATAGADWDVQAGGELRLDGRRASGPLPALTGLGARLGFSAARLYDSARIVLPAGELSLEASGSSAADSLTIASGAVLDVAGQRRDFGGSTALAPAGSLRLRVAAGDLQIQSGALLDISAPDGGQAGELSLLAPGGQVFAAGTLRAAAGTDAGHSGGAIADLGSLADFGALNDFLEAGGAARERRLRVRGGNVQIAADDAVHARRFSLTVENGDLTLAGRIDARGPQGGALTLAAAGALTLASTARLEAGATAAGASGGRVQLLTAGAATGTTAVGAIRVMAGAQIDLGGGAGGEDGELSLRLPRASVLTASAAQLAQRRLVLDGSLLGVGTTVIEGFRAYSFTSIGSAQVAAQAGNLLYDDARAFMDQAVNLKAALGRSADPDFHMRPGIEIRSTQDLTLAAGWNLNDWRFDDEPGLLSLRAAGNLRVNANLSDGFTSALTNTSSNLQSSGESWSYRLVAGADLQSADPLSLRPLTALAAGSGNFLLGPGTAASGGGLPGLRVIRTGTGSIELAAARDLSLGNAASVIYTAGRAAGDGISLNGAGQLGGRPYPVDGGDISLQAGGDILGAPGNQLPGAWLFRSGRPADANGPASAVGWTVAFERFQQGVGALGGGTLRAEAGGNISNLSAVVPTIGVQTGGSTLEDSVLSVRGGGDLQLRAGGDILSGVFYVGRGQGLIKAGGRLIAGRTVSVDDPSPLYPVLALGDGRWTVQAASDLTVETILNPTLVSQSLAQRGPGLPKLSYFSTYAPDSGVTLASLFGAVTLNNDASALATASSSLPIATAGDLRSLAVLPPSLALRAFDGDVNFRNGFTLAPAVEGRLSVLAAHAVNFASGADVVVADSDPARLGTALAPVPRFANPATGHAAVPVHAADRGPWHEVIARDGSLSMGSDARLVTPSPARLLTGGDLIDPNLVFQHVDGRDYSLLEVGRDLRYSLRRDATGKLQQTLAGIALAGPGRLQINTARNLDLGTSRGIETLGNQTNPALMAAGASIDLGVGLFAPTPDFAGFIDRYLGADSPRLLAYAAQRQGSPVTSGAAALAWFKALAPAAQQPLVHAVLFDELAKAGRAAAAARDSGAYVRGFAALDSLYPDARYAGDLSLFFSKIYTLAGGDINLLVPGGSINTGLAAVSAGFGLSKLPSELGVVAQSTGDVRAVAHEDILVNQSRVFAADGGSLLLWSSTGDIDAGRGAKTAISAPPPTITTDANGNVIVRFPPALTGSGIQNFVTTPGRTPGDVELYAPRGFVNASDAGVGSAGKVFTSLNVINTTNIAAAGGVVGTPVVATATLGGALAGVGGAASAATQTALGAGDESRSRAAADSVVPNSFSLNLISVEVLGFGE